MQLKSGPYQKSERDYNHNNMRIVEGAATNLERDESREPIKNTAELSESLQNLLAEAERIPDDVIAEAETEIAKNAELLDTKGNEEEKNTGNDAAEAYRAGLAEARQSLFESLKHERYEDVADQIPKELPPEFEVFDDVEKPEPELDQDKDTKAIARANKEIKKSSKPVSVKTDMSDIARNRFGQSQDLLKKANQLEKMADNAPTEKIKRKLKAEATHLEAEVNKLSFNAHLIEQAPKRLSNIQDDTYEKSPDYEPEPDEGELTREIAEANSSRHAMRLRPEEMDSQGVQQVSPENRKPEKSISSRLEKAKRTYAEKMAEQGKELASKILEYRERLKTYKENLEKLGKDPKANKKSIKALNAHIEVFESRVEVEQNKLDKIRAILVPITGEVFDVQKEREIFENLHINNQPEESQESDSASASSTSSHQSSSSSGPFSSTVYSQPQSLSSGSSYEIGNKNKKQGWFKSVFTWFFGK
jgi:hypothetical protein